MNVRNVIVCIQVYNIDKYEIISQIYIYQNVNGISLMCNRWLQFCMNHVDKYSHTLQLTIMSINYSVSVPTYSSTRNYT